MQDHIKKHIASHLEVMTRVAEELTESIAGCAEEISKALSIGRKVLVMGNGGSAADAQHFAAELVGRFLRERKALPAVALTTDSSVLTAVGNDYGFDAIFSRQVEALVESGDVVVGISTSGQSENVHRALLVARQAGCFTVGLLGRDGGQISEIVDADLTVPSESTPLIQEAHVAIIHILCDLIEQEACAHSDLC
ncbi:MAG: phosphoheptose isomerase [Desulfuromonas sp.]|nr:MAG: phosphoheptose isomerase [Desulfuromonas sp.]